jgi:hypothetical protein
MNERHTPAHIETWRREGVAPIEGFFTPEEVAAVVADFELLFADRKGAAEPLSKKKPGEIGRFNNAQFSGFDAIPFPCSPTLNLIGVHPALVAFAKDALAAPGVHLYQCQVWAKYTGDADYDQPFHCDFSNHTLTAPSDDAAQNSVTILCYFSDVGETHGPMHYVTRNDSAKIAGPEASINLDPEVQKTLQAELQRYERSSAAPAGTIIPYSIDVYHRGTNLLEPHGHRYAVMACFKAAHDDAIGYHAWPYHHLKPWRRIFEHATPAQLECFGVPPPGHKFWTETTLARAQLRYPGWDMAPYRAAMARAA